VQRVIAGRNWRRRREAPRKAPGPVFLEFRPAHRDIAGTGLSSLGAGMEFEMANWNDPQTTRTPWGEPAASAGVVGAPRVGTVDQGLRSYMLSIYNYMTSGVLLTGIVALLFSSGGVNSPAARVFLTGGLLAWILMLAPLAIVFAMSFGANRFAKSTLQMLYWGFAVLMGLSLSTIFLVYTGGSIAATFFATAGAFAGLSLVGYTTKKDLSAFGTFLIMGVVGLIVASVINMFVQSPGLMWAISFLGVLIFAGLTAYDTQRLKVSYYTMRGTEWAGKMIVLGALSLYLDFINMFLFLLRFMGNSRN
jgi:FtsH-binding integral membrane protein